MWERERLRGREKRRGGCLVGEIILYEQKWIAMLWMLELKMLYFFLVFGAFFLIKYFSLICICSVQLSPYYRYTLHSLGCIFAARRNGRNWNSHDLHEYFPKLWSQIHNFEVDDDNTEVPSGEQSRHLNWNNFQCERSTSNHNFSVHLIAAREEKIGGHSSVAVLDWGAENRELLIAVFSPNAQLHSLHTSSE